MLVLTVVGRWARPSCSQALYAADSVLDSIYKVPANGGNLSRLIALESAQRERPRYPQLLPGGRAVLFKA